MLVWSRIEFSTFLLQWPRVVHYQQTKVIYFYLRFNTSWCCLLFVVCLCLCPFMAYNVQETVITRERIKAGTPKPTSAAIASVIPKNWSCHFLTTASWIIECKLQKNSQLACSASHPRHGNWYLPFQQNHYKCQQFLKNWGQVTLSASQFLNWCKRMYEKAHCTWQNQAERCFITSSRQFYFTMKSSASSQILLIPNRLFTCDIKSAPATSSPNPIQRSRSDSYFSWRQFELINKYTVKVIRATYCLVICLVTV